MVVPPLLAVTAVVLTGAGIAMALTAAGIIGRTGLGRFRRNLLARPRETLGPLALLGGVLLLNKFLRDVAPEVSHLLGWNVTGLIYGLEGTFVAHLQSVASPPLTAVAATLYLSGYVFLLAFPLLAYGSLSDLAALRGLAVAVSVNYLVGLLFYAMLVSYGPRNMLPDVVEPLLYTTFPSSQLLTSQVNTNTNVFPSLHTSLSTTVVLFAWRTRGAYPSWPRVATPVAVGVVLSTMYLGIHWATDVVAGVGLGLAAYLVATRRDGWGRDP